MFDEKSSKHNPSSRSLKPNLPMNRKHILLFMLGSAILFIWSYRLDRTAPCEFCSIPPLPMNRLSFPRYPAPPSPDQWKSLTPEQRLTDVRQRLLQPLTRELNAFGTPLGSPVFIRIFKESLELELWLEKNGGWTLLRTHPIAGMSGGLGPKQREGDRQAPEGCYAVTPNALNPRSSYHLSFDIGYPNAHDQSLGRTGSLIMIHGSDVSIGCFAMTDPVIEEIYFLVEAALAKGQAHVPVHIFPFRMTSARLTQATGDPHLGFWTELKTLHDQFESLRKISPALVPRDGTAF